MKCKTLLSLVPFLAAYAGAQTVLFDFGQTGGISTGNFNNITGANSTFTDVTDASGNATSIDLWVSGFGLNDATYAAVGAVDVFPASATSDVLWGNAGSGESAGSDVVFSDLNPTLTYDFKIFASRPGSTGRLVLYTVTGATVDTAILDVSAAGTDGTVATISGIQPDGSNQITLNVNKASGSSSTYFYLSALELSTSAVPEPSVLSAAVGLLALVGWVRRRR